jgi:hypothetical protein
MEPEVSPVSPPPSPPPRRRIGIPALLLVLIAAAAAGFFLYRRGSVSATPAPAAGGAPAPAALIANSPVLLNAKASLIADRYRCLCGECSDTLGKCTCTRDKGSNEMKATLNALAGAKKSVAEIDQAMVKRYGPKVMAPGAAATPVPPNPGTQ